MMALFPAYSLSKKNVEDVPEDPPMWPAHAEPPERTEAQLLASDSDEGEQPAPRRASPPAESAAFYRDCRRDRGNLRVSTLYYPGRPEYSRARAVRAPKRPRAARYYASRAPDAPDAPARHERVAAFRRLLAAAPGDAALWERFVDFQEACGGADAALAAADEAAARLPAAPGPRARLLTALRRALPPHAALARLRALLAAEREPRARVPLWLALLDALAAAPGADAAQLDAAAAAALADARALPAAYPRLLYAFGRLLRAAGLSERLVLLVELVVAMNFAPAAPFPPAPPAPPDERAAELLLQRREDAVLASGLPLGAVWVRVERLRAEAHWRAPVGAAGADPQRTPLPHDVADLLLPVAAPAELLRLAVRLLLLAKVPLLPAGEAAARWEGGAADDASALLPLLAAAAALPAAHRAHVAPEEARRALRLLQDPPHYFSAAAGYLRWVEALWDALGARLGGAARLALLCWRLRWLGALARLGAREEAARLRACARALLRAERHPLAFAEFARLECAAAGRARGAAAGAGALRGALQRSLAAPHCLYAARAVAEASAAGAQLSAAGRSALVSAALGRAVAEPDSAQLAAALRRCEEQCDALEAAYEAADGVDADADADPAEEDAELLLLPGDAEWARARALLAPPLRRQQLLRRLLARAPGGAARGGAALRYWEAGGEALAAAAAREGRAGAVARDLLPLFPHNAQLALECAGAPLWAWSGAGGAAARLRALAPRGDAAALAALLPALARALRSDFAPPDAERLVRLARRAGGAGALPWLLRLEAEARAPRPRLPHALYAALDAVPYAKWLYVRGAAWCGAEAAALADALLERQLRLHALPDELRPLAPPGAAELPAPPTDGAGDDGDGAGDGGAPAE